MLYHVTALKRRLSFIFAISLAILVFQFSTGCSIGTSSEQCATSGTGEPRPGETAHPCAGKSAGAVCGGDSHALTYGKCTESGVCAWSNYGSEPVAPCVSCAKIRGESDAIDACEVSEGLWYAAGDCLCTGPCKVACSQGWGCTPAGEACAACAASHNVCHAELSACAADAF